jgi:hypothetical protein
MAKFSTGLRTAMLGTDDFKSLMDDCKILIYAGTVPATADAALGGATLMYTITVDGDGTLCTWGTAADGAIAKTAAESWEGECVAADDMSFFRVVKDADAGDESTSAYRVQGTVDTALADMIVASVAKDVDDPLVLNFFAVALPTN